jgi:uncharacterized protein YrrD
MRKGTDVVGKSVVAFNTGKRIARIQDLIFDQDTNQLLGFLVQEGGAFHEAKVIPLQSVRAIGANAVVIAESKSIVAAQKIPQIEKVLGRKLVLKGTQILTINGRSLGSIIDLYFDEQTGHIEGYEASGGLFADAYSGRSFIPAPQTIRIGEEVTFVPPETASLMEEQVGGLRGAMESAGSKVQESAGVANEKLHQVATSVGDSLQQGGQGAIAMKDAASQAGNKLQDLTQGAKSSLNGAIARVSVDQAQGRRIQQMVRDGNGFIIAAPGQIVTSTVVERAKVHHQEAALLSAVGLQPSEAAQYSTSGALTETKDRLKEGAATVQENASTFWHDLKIQFRRFKNQSSRTIHSHRIEQALGRPVSRVILDPQDQVILNMGELITHRAIWQAEQAGVLNILLSSVYLKRPEISTAEMRAPERGMAALEGSK